MSCHMELISLAVCAYLHLGWRDVCRRRRDSMWCRYKSTFKKTLYGYGEDLESGVIDRVQGHYINHDSIP